MPRLTFELIMLYAGGAAEWVAGCLVACLTLGQVDSVLALLTQFASAAAAAAAAACLQLVFQLNFTAL